MVDATRDLILNADDVKLVKVAIPDWKDKDGNILDVYVKQMTGDAAQDYIDSLNELNGGEKFRNAKVLVASICYKNGDPMFTLDDIKALNRKNARVLNWLAEEILRINFKSADEIETDAKNS